MPISRRYMFHGHAAPLGGRIVRMGEGKDAKAIKDGFIDLPGSALTVVGGRSTAEITGGQIANEVARSVVRFQSATAFSEGIYDDLKGHFAATLGEREHATLTATTKVSAEVNGLEVGLNGEVRMMIKRLRGGFTSRSASSNAETPVQLDSDTKFDGVTFIDKSGKTYTLVIEVEPSVFRDYDTFSALTGAASESKFISKFGHTLFLGEVGFGKTVPTAPTLIRTDGGAVQGTIVRPLKWKGEPFPAASIDQRARNAVKIPGLGTIFFGEISVARQARRITMVRGQLGSPMGGDFAAGDFQDNGAWGF